jgi:hypothetical protein
MRKREVARLAANYAGIEVFASRWRAIVYAEWLFLGGHLMPGRKGTVCELNKFKPTQKVTGTIKWQELPKEPSKPQSKRS